MARAAMRASTMPNAIKTAVGILMEGNACAGWAYPSAPVRPGEVSRGYFVELELMAPLDGGFLSSGTEFFEGILILRIPQSKSRHYPCVYTPAFAAIGLFEIDGWVLLSNYKLVIPILAASARSAKH